MKAIKNVCAEGSITQFRKLICIIAVLFVLTFMSSCTAEELPASQHEEVIIPLDGVEANGDVEGDPVKVIIPIPPAPPKK